VASAVGNAEGDKRPLYGAGGQPTHDRFVVENGEGLVPQMVLTGDASGRFPGALHGREDQPKQHGQDGKDDEKLDQRERAS